MNNKKVLICKQCGKKYPVTHKRSTTKYPKTAQCTKEDPLTKDTVYNGYIYNTTDQMCIRCFSKHHALALAEISGLGRIRFLSEK
jgi:hypothetical protein